MGQIIWTEKSSNNLESIYEYIAHDSSVYASRFIKSLIKSTNILQTQPLIGRIVPEINEESIREILFKDYRIVYRVLKSNDVIILSVYHGARDFKSINLKE